jgi:formylglycine-generating enzyme required for sulfatase activity
VPPAKLLLAPAVFPTPAFAISRYPVTHTQFGQFIISGGYTKNAWWDERGWAIKEKEKWTEPRHWHNREWNQPNHPVVGVSWYEAMAFGRGLSQATDQTITLPNEQQWQRAAQGDDGRLYPWGNEEPDGRFCNWNRDIDETTPVDHYPNGARPYGVMDLCGNVWEWCLTGWQSGTEDAGSDEPRSLRGGSWSSDSPLSLRVTNRSAKDPNTRLAPDYRHHVTVGFRCVRL